MGRGAGAGYKTRLTGLTGSLRHKTSSRFPYRDVLRFLSHFTSHRVPPGIDYGRKPWAAANEGLKAVGFKLLPVISDSLAVAVIAVPLGFGPGWRQEFEYPRSPIRLSAETRKRGC